MYDEGHHDFFSKRILGGRFMKKTKSNAAYTNKWLSRNRRFWHEEHVDGKPVIIIDKKDAPKIVLARVKEINAKRGWNNFDTTDEEMAVYWEKECGIDRDSINKFYGRNLLSPSKIEESPQTKEENEDYDEYDEYYSDDNK